MDDGRLPVADSSGPALLADLQAINRDVEACGLEMERLARMTDLPDTAAISTARLRFSRALRRHLQHVDEAVLKHLGDTTDAAAWQAVVGYRRLLHDYHEAAAHHVARWPSTRVTADWEGYRRSVAEMLTRLRKRLEVEQREIHPLLSDPRNRR